MGKLKKFLQSKYFYIVLRIIVALNLGVFVVLLALNTDAEIKSQYVFNIVQCTVFLFVSLLPHLIKKMNVRVPDYFYIIFIMFCWAHFILGEVRGFYVNVKGWDSLLHGLSGGLIALGCFSFVNLLNDNDIVHINKFVIVLSAFTLTVTIGVVWEIVEFSVDGIFGTNMQRAYNSITGEPFVGREAVTDTMKDLILDTIGALITCTICGLIIKKSGEVPKSLLSYKIKDDMPIGINKSTEKLVDGKDNTITTEEIKDNESNEGSANLSEKPKVNSGKNK